MKYTDNVSKEQIKRAEHYLFMFICYILVLCRDDMWEPRSSADLYSICCLYMYCTGPSEDYLKLAVFSLNIYCQLVGLLNRKQTFIYINFFNYVLNKLAFRHL